MTQYHPQGSFLEQVSRTIPSGSFSGSPPGLPPQHTPDGWLGSGRRSFLTVLGPACWRPGCRVGTSVTTAFVFAEDRESTLSPDLTGTLIPLSLMPSSGPGHLPKALRPNDVTLTLRGHEHLAPSSALRRHLFCAFLSSLVVPAIPAS